LNFNSTKINKNQYAWHPAMQGDAAGMPAQVRTE
jgi:hypothetical protein